MVTDADIETANGWAGYRRHIAIVPGAGCIAVDMEDDHHHFGLTIFHDGEVINKIKTRAIRYPWTSCFDASVYLIKRMEGLTLAEAASADDQRQHCTHLYDLFMLGIARRADKAPSEYRITVSDAAAGMKYAKIAKDGDVVLQWKLTDQPVPDQSVDDAGDIGDYAAFTAWTKTLPEAQEEAGRMFRRGILVSRGRGMEFRGGFSILEQVPNMTGVCYSFQPEHAAKATAIGATTRDFSANPDDLLKGPDDLPKGNA